MLRTERRVGDDQDRLPGDLQRGFARRSNLVGMATAWVIRFGRYGERDSWALKHGCSGRSWAEVPDLTNVTTRQQVAQIVIDTYPGSDALIANYTGQLWALRDRSSPTTCSLCR